MSLKQYASATVAVAATLLLAVGCATRSQGRSRTCTFFASETSYVGQSCDPNGSMTLVWDEVSHNATGGVWNEETTGNPCKVFPAQVTSGTIVPGVTKATTLTFDQPTVPDTFVFEGTLSTDGKTLQGMMDTIHFEAKGETVCSCRL